MPVFRLRFPHLLRLALVAAGLPFAGALAATGGGEAGLLDPDPPPFAYRQSLHAGDAEDRVGSAVAMSGGLLAVGVPGADSGNTFDTGRVDLYTWAEALGGWARMPSLKPSDFGLTLSANARFGAAVALSGRWLLIGCPGCAAADEAKAILVRIPDQIQRPGAAPSGAYEEWYRATPPALAGFGDPQEGTGAAVALSAAPGILGTESVVLAVGSPAATYGDFQFGAIAMGHLEDGDVVWESGPWYGGVEFGKYGTSLAMIGTPVSGSVATFNRYLLVGQPAWVASGQSGAYGRALLWERSGGTWTQTQSFEADAPGFLDGLGMAVAIERPSTAVVGTIALGAPGRARDGMPGGVVRIYRQETVDGPYVFDAEIQHPDAALYDRFGGALALAGGHLLVGADGRDTDLGQNAGTAYVYARRMLLPPNTFWSLRQTLLEPQIGGPNAGFGGAVALGPHAAAVGAALSDAAGPTNAGTVAAYLCDHIFSDGVDGFPPNGCSGP